MLKNDKYLNEILEQKNLARIHSLFYVIVNQDPSFSTDKFNNTFEYVKEKNIQGFIDSFDGEELLAPDKWDQDYWELTASSLVDNFSLERIKHLKDISKLIYKTDNVEQKKPAPPIENKPNVGHSAKKTPSIAITAGLAVVGVAALVVGAKSIAIVAGVAAAVALTVEMSKK